MSKRQGPLSRFTVIDLTRARAGPTAVRQLADWGADVIKIEAPASIDSSGDLGGSRHGPDFQNLQRNKRAITINLKAPEGREVLLRLVERADVLVENYRPDVKHRLGIDQDTLSKINPRLVYASISGFGQDGPYANRPGFDQIAQGMGGLMSITGQPGAGPMRVGIPIADLTAGMYLALGILIALLEREQTGEGQWVNTSLLQAQIAMLDFQAARWLVDEQVPPQAGNNHPTHIPTGVYRTADGHINIAASGQVIWRRFCAALGAEDLLEHPDYETDALRSVNRDVLNEQLERYLVQHDSAHWIAALNEAGVPSGPIYSIDEVFADPQVRHLGMTRSVEHPARGPIDIVNQPVSLQRAPDSPYTPAPDRGEHVDEVLGEFGFDAQEIRTLRERNIV